MKGEGERRQMQAGLVSGPQCGLDLGEAEGRSGRNP